MTRRRQRVGSGRKACGSANHVQPAVTIVAAWISADTGVGPSIASGSQTYSGIAPTCRPRRRAAKADGRQERRRATQVTADRGENLGELERAEVLNQQEHRQQEAEVADAVDDEGFLGRVGRGVLSNQKPISR